MPRPISIDELDRLGIDDANRLYWDKNLIVVEQPLRLTIWQQIGAIILVAAAAAQGVAAVYGPELGGSICRVRLCSG